MYWDAQCIDTNKSQTFTILHYKIKGLKLPYQLSLSFSLTENFPFSLFQSHGLLEV